MPHPTITPSARGIGRGRLRRPASAAPRGRALADEARRSGTSVIFIAALGLVCFGAHSLRAGPLVPNGTEDIALGSVTGVACYTIEPNAYRVVATFAGEGDGPLIQLDALLVDDAAIRVSTPPVRGGRRNAAFAD